MGFYTDQMGDNILLPAVPQRIISLVPSQTELLYDLGLDQEVVGITKFCVHPQKWFSEKTRVGGTKNVNMEKVKQLQPDLIIANKEENVKKQVDELRNIAPVWVSDINNLQEATAMIRSVGEMTNRNDRAALVIDNIMENFQALQTREPAISATYLIWKDPYMTVGGNTFISDMMQHTGFSNAFQSLKRYPEISVEDIRQSECGLVLLSSEPYPFNEEHIQDLQRSLPELKIVLVDGEMFSWYGSRLQYAPRYFRELIQRIK